MKSGKGDQFMKTLTPEQFAEYVANPLAADEKVRSWCNLREDRYFTVSVWPTQGLVKQTSLTRVVKAKKISKSDQSNQDVV